MGKMASHQEELGQEPKVKEELLLKSNIIESSSCAIATCDLNGKMTYGNPHFLKLWGLDNTEAFIGKPFWKFWLLDDYLKILDTLWTMHHWSNEIKAIKKDGSLFDVHVSAAMVFDTNGKAVALTSTSIDITERKRLEASARKAEQQLKLIFDSVPALIWQKDREGIYVKANKMFCNRFGCNEHEIIGKTDYDLFLPEIADRYVAVDRQVLSSGIPVFGNEDYHRKSSGELSWVCKDKKPYLDAEGNVAGTIGFALDITDRKQIQEMMIQNEAILKAKNQLKAKNKKLEEINTALNVILEKRERDEVHFQERIATNMIQSVYPFLDKIRQISLSDKQRNLLDVVRFNLNQITSQFSSQLNSVSFGLTATEIRVADLVRQGQKSKEIAQILNISYKTVESHRDKIRKKLGISNKKKNLRSYLLSIK